MRRGKPPRRHTPLRGGASPQRKTRLAKVNTARQAKRRKQYAAKLAKARKGQGYAEAMERAGGRCEYVPIRAFAGILSMTEEEAKAQMNAERCPRTRDLQAHHRTYSRFGGDELPDDYVILCPEHHALIESQLYPHRKRGAA